MSTLIVPTVSKQPMLQLTTGLYNEHPYRIRLWQNNIIPGAGTAKADFTEATFTGYASILLSGLVSVAGYDIQNRAVNEWSACTWTKSGVTGNTIYGYWVENISAVLLWCERFDSPIPMTSDGSYLVITPKLTGMSQYSNT